MSVKLLRLRIAIVTAAAVLCAAVFLAPVAGQGQAPAPAAAEERDKALRAKRIAEDFETNALVLTVFGRQGNVVTTVGEPGLYAQPVFSPDRTRLAVNKFDLESETQDI